MRYMQGTEKDARGPLLQRRFIWAVGDGKSVFVYPIVGFHRGSDLIKELEWDTYANNRYRMATMRTLLDQYKVVRE